MCGGEEEGRGTDSLWMRVVAQTVLCAGLEPTEEARGHVSLWRESVKERASRRNGRDARAV